MHLIYTLEVGAPPVDVARHLTDAASALAVVDGLEMTRDEGDLKHVSVPGTWVTPGIQFRGAVRHEVVATEPVTLRVRFAGHARGLGHDLSGDLTLRIEARNESSGSVIVADGSVSAGRVELDEDTWAALGAGIESGLVSTFGAAQPTARSTVQSTVSADSPTPGEMATTSRPVRRVLVVVAGLALIGAVRRLLEPDG